ncbi:MAG: SDR family oxidoreductase, partial [Crocinitomicaceae bacterium]|nr:SDR family oxidoreductase [Crocinitomicaceae bacterium]
ADYWMSQHMIKKRINDGGNIINIGSIEAVLPFKSELVHYSIAKAGVIALTRSIANEYGHKGFRANVILPGGIRTEGTKKIARGVFKLKFGLVKDALNFMRRVPLKRIGEPDEVANICLVLASDLSSYMTGAVIPVDGGFLSS